MTCEPKTKFTVELMETAMPFWSTIELWLCAGVSPRPASDELQTHSSVIYRYIEHWIVIVGGMGGILAQSLLFDERRRYLKLTSVMFATTLAAYDFVGRFPR